MRPVGKTESIASSDVKPIVDVFLLRPKCYCGHCFGLYWIVTHHVFCMSLPTNLPSLRYGLIESTASVSRYARL
jgi:hypothetical protein